ncbi:STAS-like domain-containing protein [Vibrio cholerae]|uniref:STAS-like domain-containing protein n=1 Tax=Vibrio cholerae TaxID=666 RepID=UPI0028DAF154|nr:STAS-like domain-containing protein [Vibrio cholerae]EKF9974973.1 STAS-like domain-containing protein [Vibrio cholerae]ELJ8487207.1 STAS-like domain-containing protein [Vibrio cholerae]ELK0391591.1 STAS-like domain-containing protein [Vibrio cholerae]HDL9486918.1 STAS-like domain-containing protein [Vibrio cholerae]
MKIDVATVVGKTAVSRESGLKLKDALDTALHGSTKVELDFSAVQVYASPFFNTAIAPYLGQLTIQELLEKVSFENLSPIGRKLLNQVIHNAIEFYSKAESEQLDLEEKVNKGLE